MWQLISMSILRYFMCVNGFSSQVEVSFSAYSFLRDFNYTTHYTYSKSITRYSGCSVAILQCCVQLYVAVLHVLQCCRCICSTAVPSLWGWCWCWMQCCMLQNCIMQNEHCNTAYSTANLQWVQRCSIAVLTCMLQSWRECNATTTTSSTWDAVTKEWQP